MKRFSQFIKEGGNAVSDVVPINQENSIATVKDIYKKLLPKIGIKESDVAMLGSTGKKAPKAQSGDIDLALSAPALLKSNKVNTFDEVMKKIEAAVKTLGVEYNYMKGLGVFSIAYPIKNEDGLQEGEYVQLDLMVVQDIKFSAWAYFSPSYLQSNLKGLYRNALIMATAKFMGHKTLKTDVESNEAIEWERYFFNMNTGLEHGKQTRISAKTGKVGKTHRSFDKSTITNKPDEIVKHMFGPHMTASKMLTYDDAFNAIMSSKFPHKSIRKKIFQEAAKVLNKKGFPIPENMNKQL